MDKRFDAMDKRLDIVDLRFDRLESWLDGMKWQQDYLSRKLDNLQLDMKIFERTVTNDIRTLKDGMDTITELLKIHNIVQL